MLILKTFNTAIQIAKLIIEARFINLQLYLLPLPFLFLDEQIWITISWRICHYILHESTMRSWWTFTSPIARCVQLGAMHRLQMQMQPIGICKTSKKNILISPLKSMRQPTPYKCCLLNSHSSKPFIIKNGCKGEMLYAILRNAFCK
jgi:hypothetical protein